MNPVTGLLYSQIGYDLGSPMQAIVRGPQGTLPSEGAAFRVLQAQTGQAAFTGAARHWGSLWQSDWWVAGFSGLPAGEYVLAIDVPGGREAFRSAPFAVGPALLWERTWRQVGLDQNERRALLAMNKVGWQDCGASWQEADSHAGLILGLCDLLEFAPDRLTAADRHRTEAQIQNGCDYLALLQDRASALELGDGAVSHQTPKFEEFALASDTAQACTAWAVAARLLSAEHEAVKDAYRARAERAYRWLTTAARPCGPFGFSNVNHGAPADFTAPADEWMTKDLLLFAWAALSLHELGGRAAYQDDAAAFAQQILRRQIARSRPEGPYYGHFRTFAGAEFTEKAWAHHIENAGPGADAGNHYPHFVLPLLWMARAWPEHPQAARWAEAVRDFAYGYFLPACRANPFRLLPLGYFAGEGLLWFAGLWHGMNAAYGLAAAMALEFEERFQDSAFREIAVGNLQWIAGLNAGLTAEGMYASHIFTADIAPGEAVPVSMIHQIGARAAGTWFNVRGAICNGFSTGNQFRYDVAPTVANDGPFTFTDEDWITHAGAWLSALARLPLP